MSILQATNNYSITRKFFKTFRTRSQQVKLESWKAESTQLRKGIYANCLSFNNKFVCHSEMHTE